MKTIAFFDTKPYDRENFDRWNTQYQIRYLPEKLSARTAELARGADAVCAFVNDTLDAPVIAALYQLGIRVVALRCAGFDNVDAAAAQEKIHILRVPAYSPYAVAEHAVGLLLRGFAIFHLTKFCKKAMSSRCTAHSPRRHTTCWTRRHFPGSSRGLFSSIPPAAG